ncbi:RloB-like protein [Streptomyces sp. BK022]|uniref:RloB family protein n=1 Tax=Streptomyces sp. BK022 TaxID=2512123 RepID=UPI00102A767E|nr:RloB family protein [Streptomyces sp. BK022]RZU29466.1 RloB-like protein [Streptomyces sp. BK022]
MKRVGGNLKRSRGRRALKQRFLIYCEGAVTEKEYLDGYRLLLRSPNIQIKFGRTHGVPSELIEDAVAHQARAPRSAEDKHERYDQVWCVMDVEAPQQHPNLESVLTKARKNQIKCAISNPCFEVWLILHFVNRCSYLSSHQACVELQGHDCGYSRDAKHLDFEKFPPLYEMAKNRAVQLRAGAGSFSIGGNPSSSVYELVDELIAHS